MEEVTGPIIAIALVLCAVFVPVALLPGFTGQFYRQFALTIAVSTVISAINSLSLSPALAAILLQPREAPRDPLTRLLDRGLGWIFRPFNRFFRAGSERYRGGVERLAASAGLAPRRVRRAAGTHSAGFPAGSRRVLPAAGQAVPAWGSPSFRMPPRLTAPTRYSGR